MANTLQIKRSNSTATPSSLNYGELAYSQNSSKLFVGQADGSSVEVVGGSGAFLRSDTNDTFNGNLTVTGTLTVQGSTTTIESNTLTVGDNIIVLNNDVTGTPSQDAGIEIERGSSDNALIGWKEDGDIFEFKVGSSAGSIGTVANITASGNLSVDGVSNLDNTDIDGTLVVDGSNISLDSTSTLNIDCSNTSNGITIGTATSAVPISIGHGTSETTINDNATVSGNLAVTGSITGSSTVQGTTITATTAFVPDASDGASLGTASLEFSDLFLADGAIIKFGDDQDVTLTHVADTGLLLNGSSQLQFSDASQNITAPNNTTLDINATDEVEINATLIDINGNGDVSGTLAVGSNATITGTLSCAGFTSTGIDDNCTGERLQLADSTIEIMASGVTLSGFSSGTSTLDKFVIDGGTF
jgi:hypothetical protein